MKIFKNKLRFSWVYLLMSILLFLIEFIIEQQAHDNFIRPYFGDFLIVMLLYTLIRSFWNSNSTFTALSVLIYAYVLEFSQYLQLSRHLGVENTWVGRLILGNYFAWGDIIAYTLGIIVVISLERISSSLVKQRNIR